MLSIVTLVFLTGCSVFRSYKEPTEGARARVRLIGNQPGMATYQCGDEEADPRGFAYYGGKRHDLHMPNPPKETGGLTEYYVVADKHLTVSFGDVSLIPPKQQRGQNTFLGRPRGRIFATRPSSASIAA
jgi:hypothetical protein